MEAMELLVTPRDGSISTDLSTAGHTTTADMTSVGVKDAKESENSGMDSKHTVVFIIQMIFLILLCVFGTLINSLVFWVFNRRPALRSLSNRFVLSLVTANILISSMIAPLVLFEKILNEYLVLPCIAELIAMISNAVIFAAIFSTFLIAVDRFYAVTSPLHYSMTITRSRSQIMIVVAWLSGALLALPYIIICSIPFNSELHHSLHVFFTIVQIFLGYVFPFVGLFWLYHRMYNAAHRNSERTRKHSISGELLTVMDGSTSMIPQGIDFLTHYMNPFSKTPMAGSVQPPLPPAGKKQRRRSSNGSSSSLLFREEGRAIKTAFLVLASFLLCWTPHFTFMFVNEVQIIKQNFSQIVRLYGEWTQFFGVGGILVSSVVNPFIYVFRNKMACKEVSKLLCGFWKKHRDLKKGIKDGSGGGSHRRYDASMANGKGGGGGVNENEYHQNPHDPLLNHTHHPYTPSNKSPKRSSMKSLTPQSSLNSTITNVHSIGPDSPLILPDRSRFAATNNNNNNNNNSGSSTSSCNNNNDDQDAGGNNNNNYKPPFIRSLTLPEQSAQPRVKFPPNLIRQKSYYPRSHTGSAAELTPALSKKSRFVRQDSICSVTSNDSVLMICAEDGVSVTDIGIGPGSTCIAGNGLPLSGISGRYLRQDSNFSDVSHKTTDSGVVIDMGRYMNGGSSIAGGSGGGGGPPPCTTTVTTTAKSQTSSSAVDTLVTAQPSSSRGTGASITSACNGQLPCLQTTI